MLWTHTTINGRECSATDCNGKRLYVSQQSSDKLRFDAWVDSIRLGVFASAEAARKACIASSAGVRVVAPKPECRPVVRNDAGKFAARKFVRSTSPVNATIQVDGLPPLPVDVAIPDTTPMTVDLAIDQTVADSDPATGIYLALYSDVPLTEEDIVGASEVAAITVGEFVKRLGYCDHCGVKLGRSGKCPALCTPVTDAVPYKDTGLIGKSHTARLGAPVSW